MTATREELARSVQLKININVSRQCIKKDFGDRERHNWSNAEGESLRKFSVILKEEHHEGLDLLEGVG